MADQVKPNLAEMLLQVASDAADENKHDVVLDTVRAIQNRPGVRTTEFYLAILVTLVGLAMQFWPGHEFIGGIMMTGATGLYTLSRGIVKAAAVRVAVLFFALVLASGCGPEGYVKADAISITVKSIRARHDAYVQADPKYHAGITPAEVSMNEARQRTDLRDTELLDSLIDEALAQGQKKATADANTDRK